MIKVSEVFRNRALRCPTVSSVAKPGRNAFYLWMRNRTNCTSAGACGA